MLTYYKSSKRSKILATLDLIKVGSICVNLEDPTGCTFQIQVAGRPYFLKAENNGTCQDWVINLNRVREARIQLGGMKLVAPHPTFQPHPEADERKNLDRKQSESSTEMIARVTVDANRVRTKKITDFDDAPQSTDLARWQKRQSTLQMVKSRLARFRRWMQLMRCAGTQQESVIMHAVPDTTIHHVSYTPNFIQRKIPIIKINFAHVFIYILSFQTNSRIFTHIQMGFKVGLKIELLKSLSYHLDKLFRLLKILHLLVLAAVLIVHDLKSYSKGRGVVEKPQP